MKGFIRILSLIVCIAGFIPCGASASASGEASEAVPADSLTALRAFAEIPLEVLDMVRPSSRLDMIDYYSHADSLWSAPNAMGGKSRLLQVADDYLRMEVTPSSTLEIKILPRGKDRIVMTLYTVGDSDVAKDTEIRFFDRALNPIDGRQMLSLPSLKSFFRLKGSGVKESELLEAVPFAAVYCTTGPGDTPLTAVLTSADLLPQETSGLLKPLLIPGFAARWNGKSFKFRPLPD